MAVMNTESERPAQRRSRYPAEFRRDASALVIDQHRLSQTCRESSGSSSRPSATGCAKRGSTVVTARASRAPSAPRSSSCAARIVNCARSVTS